jgi:hypothetical protein
MHFEESAQISAVSKGPDWQLNQSPPHTLLSILSSAGAEKPDNVLRKMKSTVQVLSLPKCLQAHGRRQNLNKLFRPSVLSVSGLLCGLVGELESKDSQGAIEKKEKRQKALPGLHNLDWAAQISFGYSGPFCYISA